MNMSVMHVDMLVSSLLTCAWTQRKWFEKKKSDRVGMNDCVNAAFAKCDVRFVGKRQVHLKLFNYLVFPL